MAINLEEELKKAERKIVDLTIEDKKLKDALSEIKHKADITPYNNEEMIECINQIQDIIKWLDVDI